MHRRDAISLCLTAIAAPAVLDAQTPTPPAATPAAVPQATGKAPSLAFAAETGILLSPIVPAQSAVFEEVMEKVKESLVKSTDPVRKQQAAGWKVYKATEPFLATTLYVSIMNPAIKGAEYNVFELLQTLMGDSDARALFQKFRTAFAGPQHVLNLTAVTVMNPDAPASGTPGLDLLPL